MTTTCSRAVIWAALALILAGSAAASAQTAETLAKAKALYAEAAYEEALNVLGTGGGPESHQYRALCLIALGRTQDAERAIETLVQTSPLYAVPEGDLPPRLVSLFANTRRKVMPDVVRRLFTEGRAEYQAKQLDSARVKFEQVMKLLHDPGMAAAEDAKDLELLTTGYLDIVKNAPPPPPVPVKAPASPVSAAAPAAVRPGGAAPPASPPRSMVIRPAVTVRQDIPPFTMKLDASRGEVTGAVRVIIGADGKVKSAAIERSIEYRYDARLLTAAKNWLYKPATRGGEPIESEKTVEIRVGQQQ
jgi:TonB family protein